MFLRVNQIRGHSDASATQICVKSHSRTSPQKQRVQSGRRKRDRDPRVPCFCSAHTHTHMCVCVCKNRSWAFSHLCEVTRPSPSSTCIRSAHLCVVRLTNATNRNRGPVLRASETHMCVCATSLTTDSLLLPRTIATTPTCLCKTIHTAC